MSVGPEALISMLVGHAVLNFQSSDPQVPSTAIAVIICFLVGFFNLILGLLHLGFVDSLLSRPLLRGFITAVAFVILAGQTVAMLGLGALAQKKLPESASAWTKLYFIYENWEKTHSYTIYVSLASVILLLGGACIKKKVARSDSYRWIAYIPEIFVCVVMMTGFSYLGDWKNQYNVDILGPVAGGGKLPEFSLPRLSLPFQDLILTSALIAIIGFVESMIVAKEYSTRHGYSCSANRELVAMGGANIISSFFGGFPSFGSMARSGVNDGAGAKTPFAGFVTSIMVMSALLWLLPLLVSLPKATLAALIFVAALGLLSELPNDAKFLWEVQAWGDIALAMFVFAVTSGVSVETGTLMSVGISILMVIRNTTVPRISVLGLDRTNGRYVPLHDLPENEAADPLVDGLLILRVEQTLYFANTGQLKNRLSRLERFADLHAHPALQEPLLPPVWDIALDMEHMPSIDATAVQILKETIEDYHERGIRIHIVKLRKGQPQKIFEDSGLQALIGYDKFYDKIENVVEWVKVANNAI